MSTAVAAFDGVTLKMSSVYVDLALSNYSIVAIVGIGELSFVRILLSTHAGERTHRQTDRQTDREREHITTAHNHPTRRIPIRRYPASA